MSDSFLHDTGCGPRFIGRRISVYDLVPYFLETDTTEEMICEIYQLTPEQVAEARAYVFNHFDEVMAVHWKIEARNAAGNPPEVVERLKRTHEEFEAYRRQFNEQRRAEAAAQGNMETPLSPGGKAPTFREMIKERIALRKGS